jgi:hypothetical protein
MMLPSQFSLGSAFPPSTGGGTGATLTLSQAPCADGVTCCNKAGSVCAAWAGAHLISAGCIQYGVLEMELAFDMPLAGGGFYFTATYLVGGSVDPSWNEIDVGMINGPSGLEFHATAFTAAPATPTVTTMDALSFAPSPLGTSLNGAAIHTVNNLAVPTMFYNATFASTFHTYKVVWHPMWTAWMIDKAVYRNISYAPWRPQSIRQILRTNTGVAGPDSHVYLRRVRFTPYSDPAVFTDAARCVSMSACRGALPVPADSFATAAAIMTVSVSGSSAGRRMLADSATDHTVAAALAAGVAGVDVAGATARVADYSVNVTFSATGITHEMILAAGSELRSAFVTGLARDVKPSSGNILIQAMHSEADTSATIISVLVTGYDSAESADVDVSKLTSVGAPHASAALSEAVGCPLVADESTHTESFDPAEAVAVAVATDEEGHPRIEIQSTMVISLSVPRSARDEVEAKLSGLINDGAAQSLINGAVASTAAGRHLLASGEVKVAAPDAVQVMRVLRGQPPEGAAMPPAKKQPPPAKATATPPGKMAAPPFKTDMPPAKTAAPPAKMVAPPSKANAPPRKMTASPPSKTGR